MKSITLERERVSYMCLSRPADPSPQLPHKPLLADMCCKGCHAILHRGCRQEYFPPERKEITALFADLSEFTAISERRDPEEVRELQEIFLKAAAEQIIRHGGTIQKYAGDAVVAFFGAPYAHEDDPVRAVRAAMGIHAAMDQISRKLGSMIETPLKMHIGINTGVAITEGSVHELWVTGDAVNVAAHLMSLARPGQTLVGEATREQAKRYYELKVLPAVRVKGRKESVRPYLVVKELPASAHMTNLSMIRSPLVGREDALSVLKSALNELKKDRSGAVLALVGDAGIGKSRIIDEIKKERPPGILWLEAKALEPNKGLPFSIWRELLAPLLPSPERTAPCSVPQGHEAPRALLRSILGRQRCTAHFLSVIYQLEDPSLEGFRPSYRKYRCFELVSSILEALAENCPTVLCIDDLHWADPSSMELIEYLLTEQRPNHSLLWLMTYRCEGSSPLRPQYREMLGKRFRVIPLKELSRQHSSEMIDRLAGTRHIPEDLKERILNQAEGNPFFIEELLRALIEAGRIRNDLEGNSDSANTELFLKIPMSVRGLIRCRIDRLDEEAKRLLFEASVIGRTFDYALLCGLSSLPQYAIKRALDILLRSELIRMEPLNEGLSLSFMHALIHEVAYESILKEQRKRLHMRVAELLEERSRHDPDRFSELLAFHFQRASSPVKAIRYSLAAGDKAIRSRCLLEAAQYQLQAVELLESNRGYPGWEDAYRKALEGASVSLRVTKAADAIPVYRKLIRFYEERQNKGEAAITKSFLVWSLCTKGRFHEARALCQKLERSLKDACRLKAICMLITTPSLIFMGRYTDAWRRISKLAGRFSRDDPFYLAGFRVLLAVIMVGRGKTAEAKDAIRRAFETCDRFQLVELKILLIPYALKLHCMRGDYREARGFNELGEKLEEIIGGRPDFAKLQRHGYMCWVARETGDTALLRKERDLYRQIASSFGFEASAPLLSLYEGWLKQEDGDTRGALSSLIRAASESEEKFPHYGCLALRSLAELLYLMGDAPEALKRAEAAVSLSKKCGQRMEKIEANRIRALAAATLGRAEEASRILGVALSESRRLGLRPTEARILEALVEYHSSMLRMRPLEASRRHRNRIRRLRQEALALWGQMQNTERVRRIKQLNLQQCL